MVQSGQFSFDDARTAFDIADINGDGEIDINDIINSLGSRLKSITIHSDKSIKLELKGIF